MAQERTGRRFAYSGSGLVRELPGTGSNGTHGAHGTSDATEADRFRAAADPTQHLTRHNPHTAP
ncbi:hypothetical protein BUE60_22925 [Pseudomonas syringae pv. actinidiae]|nr:hypothetical protein B1R35_03725 [Pseudomonas syringae pv. actinidiae]AQX63268.1 hypothetical protein B1F85_03725 [Pseudomonas syringae pv. actinidiae]PBK47868.1 hypothetical protein BUE61_27820 [Pseudomonas syringae pv. actinidiae]PBK49977.1 hypothetical protein BUE60_22925 [Pseudomonas syringae pv. actinidiae]